MTGLIFARSGRIDMPRMFAGDLPVSVGSQETEVDAGLMHPTCSVNSSG